MLQNMFRSLMVQSAYVVLTGIALIFKPNLLLETFGFPPTSEIWIRVTGILVCSLAILYMHITRENRKIAMATVISRIFIAAGFGLLVAFCPVNPALLLFAGVDVLTAVWTLAELKQQ